MTKKSWVILAEIALVIAIIGLLLATLLPAMLRR